MDDPLDLFADAMLAVPIDGEVAIAVAAHMHALWCYRRRIDRSRLGRRRCIGPMPGRRPDRHRDCRSGLSDIWRDNFGLDGCLLEYDEADFERRFHVPRSVFLRIYHAVKGRPFFAQRIIVTGRPQAHPLQNVVASFRVIDYGHSALLALPYLILVSNANFPEENSKDRFSTAARSILVVAITDF